MRCDTTLPKCRNCILRNEHCETTDPRNPGKGPSVRTLAVKDGQDQSLFSEAGRSDPSTTVIRRNLGAGTPPESSGTSDLSPRSQGMGVTSRDKGPSWLERAYQENTAAHKNRQLPVSTPDLVVNTDETAHRVKVCNPPFARIRNIQLKRLTVSRRKQRPMPVSICRYSSRSQGTRPSQFTLQAWYEPE